MNDLLYFSQGVCEQYAEYQIPIFLLGHSMGGLIASWTALKSQQSAKGQMFTGGVILSSPFFGVAPEADIGSQYEVVDRSLRFLSRRIPKLQCNALDNKGQVQLHIGNTLWFRSFCLTVSYIFRAES